MSHSAARCTSWSTRFPGYHRCIKKPPMIRWRFNMVQSHKVLFARDGLLQQHHRSTRTPRLIPCILRRWTNSLTDLIGRSYSRRRPDRGVRRQADAPAFALGLQWHPEWQVHANEESRPRSFARSAMPAGSIERSVIEHASILSSSTGTSGVHQAACISLATASCKISPRCTLTPCPQDVGLRQSRIHSLG